MNTFWLIAAGLIIVAAGAFIFGVLPWLRNTQKQSVQEPNAMSAWFAGSQAPTVIGGIAIVLFAAALYFAWAKPNANSAAQNAQEAPLAPEHVAMIKALSERLAQNPNDGSGWAMLARSYAVLGRYKDALPAYEKATNLIPNDPVLLIDYADVLGAVNGKNLQGKPAELIQRALLIDPTNIKGLNLIGSAEYQAGNYTHAVGYWEKLLKLLPPESPIANQVNTSIANARAQAAGKSSQPSSSQGGEPAASGGAHIAGTVKLSPALAAKVSATDTVFVFAKAVSGPAMPIAVIRAQVKDLPQKFVLNDSMAMMPTMKLSNFKEVTIAAKISKSGSATPQSGDLRGEVSSVKVGSEDVQLVIDKIVP